MPLGRLHNDRRTDSYQSPRLCGGARLCLSRAPPALPSRRRRDVARLTRDVDRAEAIRAVKTIQVSYAQYSQAGLWNEMAALFADKAELIYGSDDIHGKGAIGRYFLKNFGGGRLGLAPGVLHTQLVFSPIVNLSADGRTALARWHEFSMLGSHDARWAGGIMENEYVKEHGVWKIAKLRYIPVFAGSYETGWTNVGSDLPLVPYHYTPDQAGTPIPAIADNAGLPALSNNAAGELAADARRIAAMNDEDAVRNLQNAYGYYIDRKMWDDATDLFAPDAVLEVANIGIYQGTASIRRAFDRHGPVGLRQGELNDRVMPDTIITVSPDGREARARGLEFSQLGDATKGSAALALGVFENRYVKDNGVWRIREMRLFPLMATDYYQGWGKSAPTDPPPAPPYAPDHPAPASDVPQAGAIPLFFAPNPVSAKPVAYPARTALAGSGRLLAAPTAAAPAPVMTLADAARSLKRSIAFDAAENLSSAFANYIDDFQWDQSSALFAPMAGAANTSWASISGPITSANARFTSWAKCPPRAMRWTSTCAPSRSSSCRTTAIRPRCARGCSI